MNELKVAKSLLRSLILLLIITAMVSPLINSHIIPIHPAYADPRAAFIEGRKMPLCFNDGYFSNEGYTLTIGSTPITGVNFTIDDEPYETLHSEDLPAGSYTIEMPTEWKVSEDTYEFYAWTDLVMQPQRTITLTSNTSLTASYILGVERYALEIATTTVDSTPVEGVPLTVDGSLASTPFSERLKAGKYVVQMPSECEVGGSRYWFVGWAEEGCAYMDDYYWIEGESLDIGFSKYGEMINPYKTVGLRYDDVDPFANPYVIESEWNEGWLMNITYEYDGALHNVWAYALYTDRSGSMGIDGAWKEGCTNGPLGSPYGGRKTNGYATTDPMEVLHDDPDCRVVLLKTTIYDPEVPNPDDAEDPKGLPLVDLVTWVVFNKMNKYVVLVSDVKLRSESTLLGNVQVKFGRRGEWDIGTSAAPPSYAHFYHGLPYDLVQMIDDSESYVAYAAYWPELTSWRVEGISKVTRRAILTALSGWEQDDMTSWEPDTPYAFGEWVFDLSYANEESSVHEFRCATVYGMFDLTDGDDWDMGPGHENVIDSEVVFELEDMVHANASTNPTRVVDLTTDMSLTAIYTNRPVHNINEDTYYEKIQWAIGNATADDTIEVYPTTYYEHLTIDKPLKLIGKDPYTTIIDGSIEDPGGAWCLIYVTADNVTVSGLTIRNSTSWGWPAVGIYMEDDVGCNISGNIISHCSDGIGAWLCDNSIISNNIITTAEYPMWLDSSNNNIIYGNTITSGTNTWDGSLSLWSSDNNTIYGNTISNSSAAGIFLWSCSDNTIYHNNILNNAEQAYDDGDNFWDDGYPSGGNYWSDYTGVDQDDDGIGDTPYEIPDTSTDRYPLIVPWSMVFDVVWDEETYPVEIVSNSTITAFKFSQKDKQIGFNVTGPDGTTGFCEVKIPKNLLDAHPGEWTVLVDGAPVIPVVTSTATHNILSFTYSHSTQKVGIEGTIVVDNIPPAANAELTAPLIVDEDIEEVTFDGSASWDDVAIKDYKWTFEEDGTPKVLVGKIVEYTFENPGSYLVTLEVTDLRDNSDADTVLITVRDITVPLADAGPDQTAYEDTLVTFDGSASTDNVGIVSYTWTFVDVTPETLTGVTPTYTFVAPGVYVVTLNVSDAAGNWDTDTVVITVLDVTPPIANAGSDQTVYRDTLVTLDGSNSADNVGIVSYTWTFIDITPQMLAGMNPTYTIHTIGIYVITLNASDAAGNWDTDTVVVTVRQYMLSIKLSGEFDYLFMENVKIRLVALVTDIETLEPILNADVLMDIYDPDGELWVSANMTERHLGTAIYEWESNETIRRLMITRQLRKGVYLVHVQASYQGGPIASDISEFHIDPPTEETTSIPIHYAFSAIVLAGVAGLILFRRRIRSLFRRAVQ
jgi:parallel beta-helix repeat protein